jgi:hypothetical protein
MNISGVTYSQAVKALKKPVPQAATIPCSTVKAIETEISLIIFKNRCNYPHPYFFFPMLTLSFSLNG